MQKYYVIGIFLLITVIVIVLMMNSIKALNLENESFGGLQEWINPKYLDRKNIQHLIQKAKIMPYHQYLVLDDFFLPEKAQYLKSLCLPFEEISENIPDNWKKSPATFAEIPLERSQELNTIANESYYKQAIRIETFMPSFFNSKNWLNYISKLVGGVSADTVPKSFKWQLRGYGKNAPGIWIHSDNEKPRSVLFLAYFNPGWCKKDGALLQLWQDFPVNKNKSRHCFKNFITHQRVDLLTREKTIRLGPKGPGGTISLNENRDFHLVDQIVPKYNRVFICNTQVSPAWHSVTPSNNRERFCIQQWVT